MMRFREGTLAGLLLGCLAGYGGDLAAQAQNPGKLTPQEFFKLGHSRHGDAFDVGPREMPWIIEGIGKTHFPITTSNPEVQIWFDQGNTLLHSFWFYEAERAFRWCLKLDPDCAMAYWGLARASGDRERSVSFINQAAKRKDKVSERERLYIEAWQELWKDDATRRAEGRDGESGGEKRFKYLLEKICLQFPDDIEAKSLYALENLGNSNRYGNELILKQVLAQDPRHPGAHHYRIHTWDGPDGNQALDSCALYGQIAAGIGHAQHMPGHIYSGVGMWHEAAISMDAATRVEARYMRQRMIFPFNTWNYAHNRNYLSYIQEQLGMAEAAIHGAKQLFAAPQDPQYNNPDQYGTHWQGMLALMRALIKFERWKEVLDPKTFAWRDVTRDKMHRAYCEAVAQIGAGDLEKGLKSFAAHTELKKEIEKPENKSLETTYTIQALEIRARFALAKGDTLNGLALLGDAAKRELDQRENSNDPPSYPTALYNLLGRAYLQSGSPALAVAAFEKSLAVTRNDGFALSGLIESLNALGQTEKARHALGRLYFVWSDADPGLKPPESARATGLKAEPRDDSPARQRNYRKTTLDQFGPNVWEPYEAPNLEVLDQAGKRVTLRDYRGKNILLIFYLGEECPHCLEQLVEVAKRKEDLAALNTEVLAVSSNQPKSNSSSQKVKDLPFRLLSDTKFENARRFKSYDDFEKIELHSTILIDKEGKVHWSRNGGDPFKNFDFLLQEIRRMNDGAAARPNQSSPARSSAPQE